MKGLAVDDDVRIQGLIDGLSLPSSYSGPRFDALPTPATMEALLTHIKQAVAGGKGVQSGDAPVPQKVVLQLLLWTVQALRRSQQANLNEVNLQAGRLVVVGDTHGQLQDFCWLLRSHGSPTSENMYVINGDVADRGQHAVEILVMIFGYMLAVPGAMHFNRGNHESFDMNVRGFNEGGGFAMEVSHKYDSETFALFQDVFNLLPLATRVNNEVLIVHGGLSRSTTATLEQLNKINRHRPIPVSPNNPDDTLFFDLMWADPKPGDGVGLSAVRGSGCITFGANVTRRFCEVNRLRMIIRSHEVPKTLTGVQVMHDGRLVTIFSASNYCGRIGNTGGTMLLTPKLDYQLMEHWAPSLEELVAMEEAEAADRRSVELDPPAMKRRSFSYEAATLMKADVLLKMKELLAAKKGELLAFLEARDASGYGTVSVEACLEGMREVVQAKLPWDDFIGELAEPERDGTIRYRTMLARYRVSHDDDAWQNVLFADLHDALSHKALKDTFAFFDINEDGIVTYDELLQVLSRYSMGTAEASLQQLARRLLGGKELLQTEELLAHFQVQYHQVARNDGKARHPPAWAASLLDTVARQCALRKRDTVQLFRSFDSDGDGFISYAEFQQAMLHLGGYAKGDQFDRIEKMLDDLARWVDHDSRGSINYLDFIAAFRRIEGEAPAAGAGPSLDQTFISELMDDLCHMIHKHRWSLETAFAHFDVNSDGVLTVEELGLALKALSDAPFESSGASAASANLSLNLEQTKRLAAALDRDGNGYIDYNEFLAALGPRDAKEA